MGDFNFDFGINLNKKWHNLIELFDLTQSVSKPTRVTESSSTIIDHIYSTKPENIIESFVPSLSISDHFPICFTRKINNKTRKTNILQPDIGVLRTLRKTLLEQIYLAILTTSL